MRQPAICCRLPAPVLCLLRTLCKHHVQAGPSLALCLLRLLPVLHPSTRGTARLLLASTVSKPHASVGGPGERVLRWRCPAFRIACRCWAEHEPACGVALGAFRPGG